MSTVGDDELSLWLGWKRVGEVIKGRILADVIANSDLTEPEFTVLAYLDEAGGTMRQNALATAAGWDRTRLSHLLTRMEERAYVSRERLRNGVDVIVLIGGRDAFASTREPLIDAVDRHFSSKLTAEHRAALPKITDALTD